MGWGTISGGGTDGLYSITVDTGSARIAARVAFVQQQIASLQGQIVLQTAMYEAALDLEQPAAQAQEDAIAAYTAAVQAGGNGKAEMDALNKATEELSKVRAATRAEKMQLDRLKFQLGSKQKELQALQGINTTLDLQAWCADLTENGSGAVATLEIPGERGTVLVAPGCIGPTADAGQLLTRPAMTGPQAYFNAAILPGWQRWRPTYRAGTATAINYAANTMDVTLWPAQSSALGLPINEVSSLTGVSVAYMDCNAQAFEVGDDVVVAFAGASWDSPVVIGFMHNPKSCGCLGKIEFFCDFDGTQILRNQWNIYDENPPPIYYCSPDGYWQLWGDATFNTQCPPQVAGGEALYPGLVLANVPLWEAIAQYGLQGPFGPLRGPASHNVAMGTVECRFFYDSTSGFALMVEAMYLSKQDVAYPQENVSIVGFGLHVNDVRTRMYFQYATPGYYDFAPISDGWHTVKFVNGPHSGYPTTRGMKFYMDGSFIGEVNLPTIYKYCIHRFLVGVAGSFLAGYCSNGNKVDYILTLKEA